MSLKEYSELLEALEAQVKKQSGKTSEQLIKESQKVNK